jgi:hypothetical protein
MKTTNCSVCVCALTVRHSGGFSVSVLDEVPHFRAGQIQLITAGDQKQQGTQHGSGATPSRETPDFVSRARNDGLLLAKKRAVSATLGWETDQADCGLPFYCTWCMLSHTLSSYALHREEEQTSRRANGLCVFVLEVILYIVIAHWVTRLT